MTIVTANEPGWSYARGMAVLLSSYRDIVAFRPEKFNPIVIAGTRHMKAALTCLESGQFIPVHRPGVDMLLLVLEGEGRVAAGGQEDAAGPGTAVFVRAREARGLKARPRIVALHVVSRPPTDADHVEAAARRKQGDWQ